MKKIIALLLAAIMVLGLAACASKSEPADQTPAADTAADTAEPAQDETPADAEPAPADDTAVTADEADFEG